MSQIYKPLTSSGPIPPIIPTSFVTQDGTAVPAANILVIDAFDSPENNLNGITTKGGAAAGDPPGTGLSNEASIYLTNRATGTVQTVDAVSATVISFTPALVAGIIDLQIDVVAYDATGLTGASFEVNATVNADGLGGLAGIGTPNRSADGNAAFTADLINVTTGGGVINVIATGIAGRTLRWTGILTYLFGGA